MSKTIKNYFAAENKLYQMFGCDEKYPLRVMPKYSWQLIKEDGMYFLTCQEDTSNKQTFVVVKKDGKPMVFGSEGYSMIIALDCVKMAFVLEDNMKIS